MTRIVPGLTGLEIARLRDEGRHDEAEALHHEYVRWIDAHPNAFITSTEAA